MLRTADQYLDVPRKTHTGFGAPRFARSWVDQRSLHAALLVCDGNRRDARLCFGRNSDGDLAQAIRAIVVASLLCAARAKVSAFPVAQISVRLPSQIYEALIRSSVVTYALSGPAVLQDDAYCHFAIVSPTTRAGDIDLAVRPIIGFDNGCALRYIDGQ